MSEQGSGLICRKTTSPMFGKDSPVKNVSIWSAIVFRSILEPRKAMDKLKRAEDMFVIVRLHFRFDLASHCIFRLVNALINSICSYQRIMG